MIPTFYLLDGDLDAVSLVRNPAVEVSFLCFNKQEPVKMSFNDDKHQITGVAILADTPIYRFNPQIGEHYVSFSKELIENLVYKFFHHHKQEETNLEHSDIVENLTLIESYFVNHSRGIVPTEFADVPDGSWIVTYRVNNPEVYEKIKNGEVTGYSIQGQFTYPDEAFNKEEDEMTAFLESLLG